jgi:hypothetical protein
VWAWIKALFVYLAGRKAGEATTKQAEVQATTDALEQRAKTDDAIARAGDDANRNSLHQWSSKL